MAPPTAEQVRKGETLAFEFVGRPNDLSLRLYNRAGARCTEDVGRCGEEVSRACLPLAGRRRWRRQGRRG